jgi:DNA-binding MarR family transcriptional regulator
MDTDSKLSPETRKLAEKINDLRRMNVKPGAHSELRHRQLHFLVMLNQLIRPTQKGIRPSEMSEKLNITRGAITHILNELDKSGYIERIADPDDHRVVLIRPTEEGLRIMDESYQHLMTRLDGLVTYLGEKDAQDLNRILTRVLSYMLKMHNRDIDPENINNGERKI